MEDISDDSGDNVSRTDDEHFLLSLPFPQSPVAGLFLRHLPAYRVSKESTAPWHWQGCLETHVTPVTVRSALQATSGALLSGGRRQREDESENASLTGINTPRRHVRGGWWGRGHSGTMIPRTPLSPACRLLSRDSDSHHHLSVD